MDSRFGHFDFGTRYVWCSRESTFRIGVESSGKKGWIIVHRCAKCFAIKRNKAALNDLEQPDNFEVIVALSAKPRAY